MQKGASELYILRGILPWQIDDSTHRQTSTRYTDWTRVRDAAETLRRKCKYMKEDMCHRNGILLDEWGSVLESITYRYRSLDSGALEYTFLHRILPDLQRGSSADKLSLILGCVDVASTWTYGHFEKTVVSKHSKKYAMYESHIDTSDVAALLNFIDEHSTLRRDQVQLHRLVKILLSALELLWNCNVPLYIREKLALKQTSIPQILCMEVGTTTLPPPVGSDVCAIECMGEDCAPHALVSGEEEIAIDLEPSSDIEID